MQTGELAYLKAKLDGDASFVDVGKLDNLTLNLNRAEIEAGNFDDGGWTPFLNGKKDATIDFSAKYKEDDAGQDKLLANYFDDTELEIEFAMIEGAGNDKYTATATVTSLTKEAPDGDVQIITGTIRITAAPTVGTQ